MSSVMFLRGRLSYSLFQQRSVLNHYEETPQPIFTVASGSSAPSLPSFMTPPPYHIAVIRDEKPPAYDEVFSQAVS